jgi:hypothetical protein
MRREKSVESGSGVAIRTLTALAFFFITIHASGQQWAFEMWHDGRIVLDQGDTLRGSVKYDLQQDIVQFTSNNQTVEVFSARKVLFFEIFDNTVRKYRQFYSLPFNAGQSSSYKSLVFFELLKNGKLSLLSRESVELRSQSTGYYGSFYTRQVLINKFFFLDEKGEVTEFVGNKNDLLSLFGKKSDDVEKYMHEHHLKIDDKYEFAQIVAYYNTL